MNGHKDVVALLLEYKADIHAKDDNALRQAIFSVHKEAVSFLLDHKANVY
jgi:ankyrin repeat protein